MSPGGEGGGAVSVFVFDFKSGRTPRGLAWEICIEPELFAVSW